MLRTTGCIIQREFLAGEQSKANLERGAPNYRPTWERYVPRSPLYEWLQIAKRTNGIKRGIGIGSHLVGNSLNSLNIAGKQR